jgi:N-acetylglucosaminyl-diphospho-decaprenol L-rhamnosyltransferase
MTRGVPIPAVDVAIVSWNTSEAALAAARAYAASEGVAARVTVIDNHSATDQRRALQEGCPAGASIVLSETNLGYGTAANRVLAEGEAEFVCVSNADVVPDPRALAELAAAVRGDARAGMVGPVFGDAADGYHAELPTAPALLGRIFVGSFMRRPAPSPPPGETIAVGQPSGACFVMSREIWERVGGFDEGFFLWYEDVDLAKRLEEAGLHNLLAGSARVGHATAESFRRLDRRSQQAIRLPSLGRYIRKHHRGLTPLAAPLLKLSTWIRAGGAERVRP